MKPKQQRALSFHFTKSPKQWHQSLFTTQISLANSQHPSPSIDLHHCKDQQVTNVIVSWPIKIQSSSKIKRLVTNHSMEDLGFPKKKKLS
jgi:hypothetical protein